MLAEIKAVRALSRPKYEAEMEPLQLRLQSLGRKAYEAKLPVLLIFEGWEGGGKGDAIKSLVARLDPRGARVYPFNAPGEDEWLRPLLWRYWRRLPGRGQVSVFESSWYKQLLKARVEDGMKRKRFLAALDAGAAFERLLAEDGMLILKFWMHVGKKEQKKRLLDWEADKATRFRADKESWRQNKHYKGWLKAADEALSRTQSPAAPWIVVESNDRRPRRLKVVRHVCDAIEKALQGMSKPAESKANGGPPVRLTTGESPADLLNLKRKLSPDRYQAELDLLEDRLGSLEHLCYVKRLPVVIVFEGMDAAGKGGAIRRLTKSLDPRGYRVIPVASPEGEEKTHHYLWRFWHRLPKAGHWTIYDRSWYGRVLVERVEGFCRPEQWGRAYAEIRDFEDQLRRSGAALVKFWLHISLEEQLRRFKDREEKDYKRYKITPEDWRNREKWPLYKDALADMLLQTSTPGAPWTLIEAEDKRWARIKVLRTVADAVEKAIEAADEPAGGFRV